MQWPSGLFKLLRRLRADNEAIKSKLEAIEQQLQRGSQSWRRHCRDSGMDYPVTDIDRIIALGASNLTRGFHAIVSAARSAWGSEIQVIAALGHGRSYGASSRVAVRTLPGGYPPIGLVADGWNLFRQCQPALS